MSRIEQYVFLVLVWSWSFVLVSLSSACLPPDSNTGSLTVLSPVVIQGQAETTGDDFDYVVFRVTAVYKGPAVEQRIVVRRFGLVENAADCIGGISALEAGGEYFLFLNRTGQRIVVEGSEGMELDLFQLMTTPRSYSEDMLETVQEATCDDCNTPNAQAKSHADRCPDDAYCFNGGSCYIIPTLGLRFCQCQTDFQGDRCQEKLLIGAKEETTGTSMKEFFFLIVIGAVAGFLVLLAIIILIVVAIRVRVGKSKSFAVSESTTRGVNYHNIPELVGTSSTTTGRSSNGNREPERYQRDSDFQNGSSYRNQYGDHDNGYHGNSSSGGSNRSRMNEKTSAENRSLLSDPRDTVTPRKVGHVTEALPVQKARRDRDIVMGHDPRNREQFKPNSSYAKDDIWMQAEDRTTLQRTMDPVDAKELKSDQFGSPLYATQV